MFKAGDRINLIHSAKETAMNLALLSSDINYCESVLQQLIYCKDYLYITDTNVFMSIAKQEYEERTGKKMAWIQNQLDGVVYLIPEEELRLVE